MHEQPRARTHMWVHECVKLQRLLAGKWRMQFVTNREFNWTNRSKRKISSKNQHKNKLLEKWSDTRILSGISTSLHSNVINGKAQTRVMSNDEPYFMQIGSISFVCVENAKREQNENKQRQTSVEMQNNKHKYCCNFSSLSFIAAAVISNWKKKLCETSSCVTISTWCRPEQTNDRKIHFHKEIFEVCLAANDKRDRATNNGQTHQTVREHSNDDDFVFPSSTLDVLRLRPLFSAATEQQKKKLQNMIYGPQLSCYFILWSFSLRFLLLLLRCSFLFGTFQMTE